MKEKNVTTHNVFYEAENQQFHNLRTCSLQFDKVADVEDYIGCGRRVIYAGKTSSTRSTNPSLICAMEYFSTTHGKMENAMIRGNPVLTIWRTR